MAAGLKSPWQHILFIICCIIDGMPIPSGVGLTPFAPMISSSVRLARQPPSILLQALDLAPQVRELAGGAPASAHAAEAAETDEEHDAHEHETDQRQEPPEAAAGRSPVSTPRHVSSSSGTSSIEKRSLYFLCKGSASI